MRLPRLRLPLFSPRSPPRFYVLRFTVAGLYRLRLVLRFTARSSLRTVSTLPGSLHGYVCVLRRLDCSLRSRYHWLHPILPFTFCFHRRTVAVTVCLRTFAVHGFVTPFRLFLPSPADYAGLPTFTDSFAVPRLPRNCTLRFTVPAALAHFWFTLRSLLVWIAVTTLVATVLHRWFCGLVSRRLLPFTLVCRFSLRAYPRAADLLVCVCGLRIHVLPPLPRVLPRRARLRLLTPHCGHTLHATGSARFTRFGSATTHGLPELRLPATLRYLRFTTTHAATPRSAFTFYRLPLPYTLGYTHTVPLHYVTFTVTVCRLPTFILGHRSVVYVTSCGSVLLQVTTAFSLRWVAVGSTAVTGYRFHAFGFGCVPVHCTARTFHARSWFPHCLVHAALHVAPRAFVFTAPPTRFTAFYGSVCVLRITATTRCGSCSTCRSPHHCRGCRFFACLRFRWVTVCLLVFAAPATCVLPAPHTLVCRITVARTLLPPARFLPLRTVCTAFSALRGSLVAFTRLRLLPAVRV